VGGDTLDWSDHQNNSPAVGASVSLMMTDVFGVEASAAYAFSDPRRQACGDLNVCAYKNLSGSLVLTSLAARVRPRRSNFTGVAGLSVGFRSGEAWEGRNSNTSLGVMLGAGVLAQVTPKLGIDVRAELHAYSLDPDEEQTDFDSAMAMDFLVKIGVPLGGRR
jgi:opacity protein-like surface antigen